jgi:hypothetical protein
MEFRIILRKTLVDLTTWRGSLVVITAGLLLPILVFWGARGSVEGLTQQMRVHYVTGMFFSICFIWTLGLLLAVVVSAKAADFIAKERSDGTLLLLVSRPVNRRWIIAAKFAALVIYAVLLETITLLLIDLVVFFLMRADTDILLALLRATMWMIPYVVLVTAIFGSIAIALSGVVIQRVSLMRSGDERPLHIVDMAYHLGNVLIPLEREAEGGHIIVTPGHWLIEWDLYSSPSNEDVIPISSYSDFPQDPASYPFKDRGISRWCSLGIWLVVIAGSAAVFVQRKEVN